MNLHETAIYGELTWGLFPFRYGNEYVNMILIHTQSTLTSVVTVTTQWTLRVNHQNTCNNRLSEH